jgi:hypothetical protein
MAVYEFKIDLDKKCKRCGKKNGITDSGLCLGCINKGITRGDYDHILRPRKREENQGQMPEEREDEEEEVEGE